MKPGGGAPGGYVALPACKHVSWEAADANYSPVHRLRDGRRRASQVERILQVSGRVAGGRERIAPAVGESIVGDFHVAKVVGGFDQGGHEAGVDMPFDVTVEEPHAWDWSVMMWGEGREEERDISGLSARNRITMYPPF